MRRSPFVRTDCCRFVRPLLKAPLISLVLAWSLTGCSRYEFTLNEQPIDGTPGLAEKVDVTDPELGECIDRTVYDQRIGQLHQLTRLSCQQNGIRSLAGIAQLQQLSYVNLSRNQLQDATPLLSLANLTEVDLRGNKALECGSVRQLVARGVRVKSPEHCR